MRELPENGVAAARSGLKGGACSGHELEPGLNKKRAEMIEIMLGTLMLLGRRPTSPCPPSV